ncbi:hypothetical protein Bca4012_010343 [Brassica carinata]|uniref:Uncharacterized protein n=1 Tax=Brassica carinata TaxID=52824 RepID=A0A8X7V3Y3_BRACI|nr:hypothetical protein Bca52824_035293 [Brassica carinata]
MVRKKTTPIYFSVNQRDPMVFQTVNPFKPFGTFVTEVLQLSGREPATIEAQNKRNDRNPAIAHETSLLLNDCITCGFTTLNNCISGRWKGTSETKADVLQSAGV